MTIQPAQREVESLIEAIRSRLKNDPVVTRATDRIELLCRAYMEPDVGFGPSFAGPTPNFTGSETKMFMLLLARRGQVVSKDALMDVILSRDCPSPDCYSVQVRIHTLRKKLIGTEYGGTVENVRGLGYRMRPAKKAN